jgi:hypothetical protein
MSINVQQKYLKAVKESIEEESKEPLRFLDYDTLRVIGYE